MGEIKINNWYKKVLVSSVIFLFLGICFIPASEAIINKDNIISNNQGDFFNDDNFDLKIKLLMKIGHVPSISMCVIDSNYSLWYKGYGYSKFLTRQKPTKDTIYLIASISKTVSATALMQLYEKGLFKLDDDVNNYLDFNVRNPYFPNVPVTFRMLLAHRSSLSGNVPKGYFYSSYIKNLRNYPYPMIREIITPNGSLYRDFIWNSYSPGRNADYADIGFILIEHLIEVLSKQKYSDYCKKNIFDPLDMKNTSFNLKDLKRNQLATPYFDIGRIFIPLPIVEGLYGIGGLRTSIDDFSHYVIAHMNDGVYENQRILNESTVDLMHSQQFLNIFYGGIKYGLGFRIWYGNRISKFSPYGHAGCGYGMTAYMGMNRSNDRAILFFMNRAFDFSKLIDIYVYFKIMELLYFNDAFS
jgi:CubicO group peptidase (beta-lactamase class C family)